jgi:four helix bundle protein
MEKSNKQVPRSKQMSNSSIRSLCRDNDQKPKYDLEERTYEFAKNVRRFVKKLPRSISNLEDIKQVIRSSGSVGANYIEANEALSKKDFLMRLRISLKETKESIYWLRLLCEMNPKEYNPEGNNLMNEATELKKIFSSIVEKSK